MSLSDATISALIAFGKLWVLSTSILGTLFLAAWSSAYAERYAERRAKQREGRTSKPRNTKTRRYSICAMLRREKRNNTTSYYYPSLAVDDDKERNYWHQFLSTWSLSKKSNEWCISQGLTWTIVRLSFVAEGESAWLVVVAGPKGTLLYLRPKLEDVPNQGSSKSVKRWLWPMDAPRPWAVDDMERELALRRSEPETSNASVQNL